ncbi:MAG: hypothetical protein WBM08_11345 [Prochlorococcaceae cyanobacterium]
MTLAVSPGAFTITDLQINFRATSVTTPTFSFSSISLGVNFLGLGPNGGLAYRSQTDAVVFGGGSLPNGLLPSVPQLISSGGPAFNYVSIVNQLQIGFTSPLNFLNPPSV